MTDTAMLSSLGLTSGEPVRFRKVDGGRWHPGKMSGIATDGSITIHNTNGSARSLRPERVEVRRPGDRGKLTWQLISDVAVTWEQLALWGDTPASKPARAAHLASAPMSAEARIDVEPDPVPIVLILAATLRRAARTPKLAEAILAANGNVALRSTVDPQAATMRLGHGGVTVVRGVSDDADVVIAADLNKLADEHPPKPKVTGAARHPKLALTVSKLLEPPHGTWQEEARRFFTFAVAHPGVPQSMRVVCTDDGSELMLGDEPAQYELHGSRHALLNVFCGNTVLGQDLLDGKLHAVGTLAHFAELTGRSLAWMLGG